MGARRGQHPLQRRRGYPRPLLRYRLSSGRGAIEQPNTGGDGELRLNAAVWFVLCATGVAAGLLADGLMFVLYTVEHVAFGFSHGSFAAAAMRASDSRRVASLAAGGALTGVGWYVLRRSSRSESSDLDDAVWAGDGSLPFSRSLASSLLSEVAVGAGASMGREAAPRLMGGASGSLLARWRRLSPAQRRLVVACGGGAGVSAVYNVPLGGALLTAEVLYGSLSLAILLPALVCSVVATTTAWIYLPNVATYPAVPHYPLRTPELVWALLAGPLIGLASVAYVRLIGTASHRRLHGRAVLVGPLAAFTVLGLVGLRYPELFGNGKDMAQAAFAGTGTFTLLLVLFALKPLVTALCLGSGATGGLFTPTFSTGALLGGALGIAWTSAWPGGAVGSYALIGAAAMTGAAMQAPLAGLVLTLELTGAMSSLVVPMVAATCLATIVARYVDGYSIYSARLPGRGPDGSGGEPSAAPAGGG